MRPLASTRLAAAAGAEGARPLKGRDERVVRLAAPRSAAWLCAVRDKERGAARLLFGVPSCSCFGGTLRGEAIIRGVLVLLPSVFISVGRSVGAEPTPFAFALYAVRLPFSIGKALKQEEVAEASGK